MQPHVRELNDPEGEVKKVDLSGELYGEVFEPLKEMAVFKQVSVNHETNTIEWPSGADFAPEFWHLSRDGKSSEQFVWRNLTYRSVWANKLSTGI
ncbi:MAG: DUF2442 domain-containing protein [Candidatus Tectomicrobia bacterium]